MTAFDAPTHGGPDGRGPVAHDFSTNGNACGPCPPALHAVRAADESRYPDPAYGALRERLAHLHDVAAGRIVIAASASEFIGRLTAAVWQGGGRRIRLPWHGYGDYARAAKAWGFEVMAGEVGPADLVWCSDPGSPLGQPEPHLARTVAQLVPGSNCVLDLAYEPLRLEGTLALDRAARDRTWQLWTPNKALGLTGVRAAYAIAPQDDEDLSARVHRLAPSWPLGAHGVALLEAWCDEPAHEWLSASLATLRDWKLRQQAMCESLGWTCSPSVANFFCARPDLPHTAEREAALHAAGIRLRDTASFGLPGQLRLAVLPPASQSALERAWTAARR
jgi:histidinol-phosphate aminotransferase